MQPSKPIPTEHPTATPLSASSPIASALLTELVFPATSSHLKYLRWSPLPSTEPSTSTTLTCTRTSSTASVKILTAAKSAELSSFPTNIQTTQLSRTCIVRDTRFQFSLSPTKTIPNTGHRDLTTIGSLRWPALVWSLSDSPTLLMDPLSELALHTWEWEATNSSRWWPINSSFTTLPSPLLWVACPSGHTPSISACHISATETLTTARLVATPFGKWSWTSWIVVMTPLLMSLCQVVTWSTPAPTFSPVNSSDVFCVTTSTVTTIPTEHLLDLTSTHHGWNQRRSTARNSSSLSRRCWEEMMCSSSPCCKSSNGCRTPQSSTRCVTSKSGRRNVMLRDKLIVHYQMHAHWLLESCRERLSVSLPAWSAPTTIHGFWVSLLNDICFKMLLKLSFDF